MALPNCWREDQQASGGYWPDYTPALTLAQETTFDALCLASLGFNTSNATEKDNGWFLRQGPYWGFAPWSILAGQIKVFLDPWWRGDASTGQAMPLTISAMLETVEGGVLVGPVNTTLQIQALMQQALAQHALMIAATLVTTPQQVQIVANQTVTMSAGIITATAQGVGSGRS